jgi:hypothetical protein
LLRIETSADLVGQEVELDFPKGHGGEPKLRKLLRVDVMIRIDVG